MLLKRIVFLSLLLSCLVCFSQKRKKTTATLVTTSVMMREIEPLAGKKMTSEIPRKEEINPKKTDANKVVPGKGLPKDLDVLLQKQKTIGAFRSNKPPSLIFETTSTSKSPSDPTGAIGPNHYVSSRNSTFAIHDRSGNVLVPPTSLTNIFPGESRGDPIVFYDQFAERFVITQFSQTPNGFLMAVCKGADPVNDGWYIYRFNTGSFPDYTKFSVWSDGYYVTANKDKGEQGKSEVVFVVEREKMLAGENNVKMVGFPLVGSRISGFYSPASFNALGKTEPPSGDARVIYFQDDSWQGVNQDALKLWKIDVNWIYPENSTITEAEELTVSNGDITPFDATFDGGSFSNLPQPGGGQKIDVLQGAVMHATNYRRFCSYNSVVFNFAVDIDNRPNTDDVSGIRWYELRQNGDGQPWFVFQEGTYGSPNGKSAWCGSMAMDIYGNIGMGYTTMGRVIDGASQDSFVSIRYTGRLADDPLGVMTFEEQSIAIGTDINKTDRSRYGDYAHLTVDPTDDQTFWHTAEYFENLGNNARNIVGVFKIAEDVSSDVGVIHIDAPGNGSFTVTEIITVTIKNFGTTTQSNIPVSYSINGNTSINEVFTGSIGAGQTASYTFDTTADLSTNAYSFINAETNLIGDIQPENDCAIIKVDNLLSNDVGVIRLVSPKDGGAFSSEEPVTVTIRNFSGVSKKDIPVFYRLDNGTLVNEVFTGTIEPETTADYTFMAKVDISEFGIYNFEAGTLLPNDEEERNDSITKVIEHQLCKPTSDCSRFGDGIISFKLSNISNNDIVCNSGYEDFTDRVIQLDKAVEAYILTVQAGFVNGDTEQLSLWINYNDDALFEESELLLSNRVLNKKEADQNFIISLGENAVLGTHLLRIRAGDTENNNGSKLNEACGSMQYGTTHDYTVEIGENGSTFNKSELIVVSQPNNQFLITMSDSDADEELRISIFTINGKTVASNFVRKNASSTFTYTLDMSYAARGVYFVKLGGNKTGKVAKFVVN